MYHGMLPWGWAAHSFFNSVTIFETQEYIKFVKTCSLLLKISPVVEMDMQGVATDECGCYSGDLIQSIQEHREGRDHVSFRHSEVFPEIVFKLGFDKWVGFRQAKQRASPKSWERANPGKFGERKVQLGRTRGVRNSSGRLAGQVQCSGFMVQANAFLTSLQEFL